MDCSNCRLERQFNAMLQAHDDRIRTAEKDILELQRARNTQEVLLTEVRTKVEHLISSVGTLLDKVENLTAVPARRYEHIVYVVIALVVGAAVRGFFP